MKASSTTATRGSDLVGPRALREWITGERKDYRRVFLVESGAAADGVAAVAGEDDVVFLPSGSELAEGRATVVRYDGALSDIGDELFLGERGVELQDYVAAAFIQIVGPTAVALFDASSWRAFFDDAELARRTGVFPSALLDPHVLLADRSALASPEGLRTPSALRVTAGGRVSVGLRGGVLGSVDDLQTLLAVPVPLAAALEGLAPAGTVVDDLRDRGWIGRYLTAIDLMRMLRLVNGDARISGFGWSLVDDGRADAEPLSADPLLLETEDGVVLADTTSLRRQLLSPVTARVVAITQTSSAPDVAAERVARELDVSTSAAAVLCREAIAALDVHFGRRADASSPITGVGR
ncbi:daptide biosynthesis RiPP recognition protein [Microbacterium sp. 3J1]|uniref:daptide biosynthesis RiPP recognition protein n=1 Tax=Microbacterium sp. 3J1 TaxID=861269 RepID=UPI000B1BE701|nr:daptide biosynthesis RiPP recognition protein [Microbacterium sp. 3J1]